MNERNDYYAFGGRWEVSGAAITDNRFRFSGKEDQTTGDLPYQDFGARFFGKKLPIFTTPDPLSEIDYPTSPYTYCRNSPIRFVDNDGRMAGDFMDEKGRYLGTDGIDDQKLYVLKTTTSSFKNGKNQVPGAGLTAETVQATKDFITTNSGNAAAFSNNSIAYDNSIQIEGSASNRQDMINEVSRDNGYGGTSDGNNREYGGSIFNGKVVLAEPGPIVDPSKSTNASIALPAGRPTFHSHPSGYAQSSSIEGRVMTTTTSFFAQPPSRTDVSNAGSLTRYVFGMRDNIVYIYNGFGVQATIPINTFVNPIR